MSISKEEAQKMYEGKFFYEVVKGTDPKIHQLCGPLDNIRFLVPFGTDTAKSLKKKEYSFAQVIDGQVRQAFTAQEIVVLDFDVREQGNERK